MLSRRRRDPRFKALVARAERLLSVHGIPGESHYAHVKSFWIGTDVSVHLLLNGKLDVNVTVGPGPDDVVHVMRRYKNGRGWFDDDHVETAMSRLAKFMVLDDLAGI